MYYSKVCVSNANLAEVTGYALQNGGGRGSQEMTYKA